MADTKLSALTALAAAPAVGDEIYIRDISESAADESKRITIANLLSGGKYGFPATAALSTDPNTLDDYEEGIFTSTILDDAADPDDSQGYVSQKGRYVKIGRLVFIFIHMNPNSLGGLTTSQAMQIGGLPFTALNSPLIDGPLTIAVTSALSLGTAGFDILPHVVLNTPRLTLRLADTAAGSSPLLLSEWGASGDGAMSGYYETAE